MNRWRLYRGGDLSEWEIRWRDAFRRSRGSVFQRFELCRQWVRVFAGDGRLRLWVLETSPERGGAGPALAGFTLADHRLAMLGQGLFDYLEPVGHATVEDQRHLARQLLGWDEWEELTLTGVPEDSAFLPLWQELAPQWQEFSTAPQVGSETSLEEFQRRHRRLLHRLHRKQEEGWRLSPVRDPFQRVALLRWILEQKQQTLRAQGKQNVLDQRAGEWLHAMVTAESELAEIWRLEDGTDTVAGLLTWLCHPVRSAYTISYSRKAPACSPGILLLCGVVRQTLAEGRQFDFLTGEQAFKLRLAGSSRRLLRLNAQRLRHTPAEAPITPYDSGTESRVR